MKQMLGMLLALCGCAALGDGVRMMAEGAAETVTERVDVIDLFRKGEVEFNISQQGDLHDAPESIFTVDAAGQLQVSGKGFGYLSTKRSFKDYRLVVEFEWPGPTFGARKGHARDNGIMFHAHGPHGLLGGTWPACVEANMVEGGMGDFIVLGGKGFPSSLDAEVTRDRDGEPIWTPGSPRETFAGGRVNWLRRDPDWKDSEGFRGVFSVEKPLGEWNRMEIIAKGDTVRVFFNGVLVNEAFGLKPAEGHVCLQTEGAALTVRKLELLPLGHRMVLADESRALLHYIDPFDPSKSFEIPCPKPLWDLQKVGEGKYRTVGGNGFTVVDLAARKVIDQFQDPALAGITALSDLPEGGFIACVNPPGVGNEIDIVRFSADRKFVSRTPFKGIFYSRTMTLLKNGEILIAHDNGFVRAKLDGTVLQSFKQPRSRNTFQAFPSRAGDGWWVATGYGTQLVFYGNDGKILKTFEAQMPDGLKNYFYAQTVELDDGHLLLSNWTGHGANDSVRGWQVIEFDELGRVVWHFHDPAKIGSVSGILPL
jgi:hypothetical protein